MKRYLILIGVILILVFCSRYFVFTRKIEKPNPLSCVYNAPIGHVREKVNEMFSDGKFHGLDFYVKENHNHFFINWFGWFSSGQYSEIYYNWWGKLKLIPSYHIFLDSVSNSQTKITINSFPKVEAGTDFSLNHLLPYITSRKVEVKPSTIEEYEIIKTIGEQLGEKHMPEIQR